MAMDCANELGLGCCYLGGIRFEANKINKLLGLSGSITPVVGMCVGYPAKINPIRPKINKIYDEKYSLTKVKQEMNEYDKVMKKYYLNTFKK
ncbi:MAG: nitroreductase family protein, partial [Mycoplasmoidaceae bacterium]|nr:nitroreductase family protein [Mycoplasmoidaceae bacterium]